MTDDVFMLDARVEKWYHKTGIGRRIAPREI
jgi:hypothetical protein